MIEMRWITKIVPDYNKPVRVLQYRQTDGGPLPEGYAHNWTDWTDVPELEDV